MKKWIALFLTLVLILGLTACGQQTVEIYSIYESEEDWESSDEAADDSAPETDETTKKPTTTKKKDTDSTTSPEASPRPETDKTTKKPTSKTSGKKTNITPVTTRPLRITEGSWEGYDMISFPVRGHTCDLICPETPAEGNPWMWRTAFQNTSAANTQNDKDLLDAGWYVAYVHVDNQYGNSYSIAVMYDFYKAVVPLKQLRDKAVMVGVSRGGLYAANYAATYPQTVAGLYLDAPVLDIRSWPGGKVLRDTGLDGADAYKGEGDAACWVGAKNCYGFGGDLEALYDESKIPVNKVDRLAKASIPVLLVYGAKDTKVPYDENGQKLVDAYAALNRQNLVKVVKFDDRAHSHGGWATANYIMQNMA